MREVVDEGSGAQAALNENVKVVVRIRPMNEAERRAKQQKSLHLFDCDRAATQQDTIFFRPPPTGTPTLAAELRNEDHGHTFRYDHVVEERSDQGEVFDLIGAPVVDAALEGINATVFACAPPDCLPPRLCASTPLRLCASAPLRLCASAPRL